MNFDISPLPGIQINTRMNPNQLQSGFQQLGSGLTNLQVFFLQQMGPQLMQHLQRIQSDLTGVISNNVGTNRADRRKFRKK